MILPGRPDQCQPKIIIYCLGLQTSMEKNVQVERGRWPKPKNVNTLRRDRELQLIFPRQNKLLIKNEEVCSRDVVACFFRGHWLGRRCRHRVRSSSKKWELPG
jgi:hypothetical protein